MPKDATQVNTTGPQAHLWIAAVGATEPATWDAAFDTGTWTDLGYLKDPPSVDRSVSSNDIEMWNALEPVASVVTSDVSTVGLVLGQTNRNVLELYFGPLTYTTEGTGVSITPNAAAGAIEKAICLELVDGTKVLRVYWRRCNISDRGAWNMDKGDAITYEVTLKRLVPASGDPYRFQTNMTALVTP
jgi:hypothetical protein